MATKVKLAAAMALCLVLIAGVLWEPMRVRSTTRAYALAPQEDPALREKLVALGDRAVPSLIDWALKPDCRNRQQVVELLRQMDVEVSLQAFSRALKEFQPTRRICAAEALGYLGEPVARTWLERAAAAEDARLAQAARQALRRINAAPDAFQKR